MDKEDFVNKLLIVVIVVLTIIVGGAVYDAAQKQEDIKHIVNVSNKIIEDVKFMELDVGDIRDGELSEAPVVYVDEESKLNVLEDMINKGEKYEFKNPVGFDILPTAYLYKENGEIIQVAAIDGHQDGANEPYENYIICSSNKADVKKIYKVDDKVGEFIKNLYNDRYDDTIMIYDGYEIYGKVGYDTLSDMVLGEDNKDRYEVKYNNYEKNKQLKDSTGEFDEETYEGYSVVYKTEKFATTKEYNLLPRQSKKLKNLPDKLKDLKEQYTKVEIEEIDLDGDFKLEYILLTQKVDTKSDEKVIKSKLQLLDSNYNTIATLASWDASKEEFADAKDLVLTLDDVMYFDLNNDSKMEILIGAPIYEGYTVGVYRFDDGILYGEKDHEVSIEP